MTVIGPVATLRQLAVAMSLIPPVTTHRQHAEDEFEDGGDEDALLEGGNGGTPERGAADKDAEVCGVGGGGGTAAAAVTANWLMVAVILTHGGLDRIGG